MSPGAVEVGHQVHARVAHGCGKTYECLLTRLSTWSNPGRRGSSRPGLPLPEEPKTDSPANPQTVTVASCRALWACLLGDPQRPTRRGPTRCSDTTWVPSSAAPTTKPLFRLAGR